MSTKMNITYQAVVRAAISSVNPVMLNGLLTGNYDADFETDPINENDLPMMEGVEGCLINNFTVIDEDGIRKLTAEFKRPFTDENVIRKTFDLGETDVKATERELNYILFCATNQYGELKVVDPAMPENDWVVTDSTRSVEEHLHEHMKHDGPLVYAMSLPFIVVNKGGNLLYITVD